jgi:hypothetical protein
MAGIHRLPLSWMTANRANALVSKAFHRLRIRENPNLQRFKTSTILLASKI